MCGQGAQNDDQSHLSAPAPARIGLDPLDFGRGHRGQRGQPQKHRRFSGPAKLSGAGASGASRMKADERTKSSRSSNAERQAAYRRRQRRGISVVSLQIENDIVERLLDAGVLGELDAANPERVASAIGDALREHLGLRPSQATVRRKGVSNEDEDA